MAMAYLPNDEEEKEGQLVPEQGQIAAPQGGQVQGAPIQQQQQQAQAEQAQGAPVQLSEGPGDITGTGQGGEEAEAATPTTEAGSGFTNIAQYLQENTPQAQALAKRVGGVVKGQGRQASEAIQSAEQQFNQAVQENTVAYNQQLADQAAAQEFQGFQDQAQADEFRRMVNAQYQGPEQLEATDFYNPAQQSVQKAQQTAGLLDTEAGRRQLLTQVQEGKRASAGVTSLNNLLLANSPEARQLLQQSRTGISDLDERLAQIAQASGTTAQQAADTTAQTRQQIQDRFLGEQGVIKQFEQDVDARTAQAIADAKARQDAILSGLQIAGNQYNTPPGVMQKVTPTFDPTDQQLADMGLNRAQWQDLIKERQRLQQDYGRSINLRDFATNIVDPTAALNRENIATAEDYARLAALSDLLGIQNTFLTNPELAGTGSLDTLDLNFGGATGQINTIRSAEEQAAAQRRAEAESARRRQDAADKANRDRNAVAAGAAAGAAVGSVVPGVGTAIGAGVGAVVGAVFCFHQGTEVLMEDGSWKKVEDVRIGDYMMYGGMVTTWGESLSPELYEHEGIKVTGNHAVFEDDKWIRVEDSKNAKEIQLTQPVRVYPIINEKHIIIPSNEIIYSDTIETDDASMLDVDRLKKLNSPEHLEKTRTIEQQVELGRSFRKENGTSRLRRVK